MPEPDPLLGATIAGIRLDEKLGTGGMGSVYLGVQTAMARRVAVKILSDHLAGNAEYISRFRREAVTAGKLEHPNIVSVYDIGHEGGRYFIVMEYVEGQSLQRILDVVGAVSPREAARLMVGILRGLHSAHAAGIVHRDVKPGNVIMNKENEPKILDFGLAIGNDPRDKLTGTGSVLGTPLYISPEQARGKAAEPRSDIYSAGVMFYALLTGRVPFSGQDPLAVLNMHLHEPPVSPLNLNPRVPQALNDIALKMLAKRPEDRYASAELAARDLQTFLDGKLVALPPRPTPRVIRRRAAPVGLIVGSVLGIVFIVALVQLSKSTPPPPPSAPTVYRLPATPDYELADAREKSAAIVATVVRDGPGDYGLYGHSMGELSTLAAKYANRKDLVAVVEAARKNVAVEADRQARRHETEIRPRLVSARVQGDVYLMRDIFREFPRAFLEITDTGKGIAQEMRQNEERVAARIAADLESIPRLLDADEFDGARARIKRLGDVAAPELRSRLTELAEQTALAETERRKRLTPLLLAEVANLEKHVASLLERRQSDEAWNAILGYVESQSPTKLAAAMVRFTQIPHVSLRGVVPSTVTEEEIDSHLARLEAEEPVAEPETPAQRMRRLCEDVLRREWIRRRAEHGLRKLDGAEVSLQSHGGLKGRIVSGAVGSQAVVVDQLEARDQVYLAAASVVGPENAVETIFKSAEHRRFATAASAAHRYTPAPDRFTEALRWLEQAKALGLPVAASRIAALEESVRQERDQLARDLLGKALEHAAAGRHDKAHEELDKAVKEHDDKSYGRLLESVARDLRGRFLLGEAEDEAKAQRWARAHAALRKLRSLAPEYAPERTTPLYHKVLLNAGAWATWPMVAPTAAGKTWTWEGKATGAQPPGRLEGGQIALSDVRGFRPLYLERPKTAGVTGLRARFRINQTQQTFEVGFHFDAKEPNADLRRYLLRSGSRAEVGTRRDGRWTLDDSAEVKPAVALKEWYEIAIVSDGTETVFYFGPQGSIQGVLTLAGGLDGKAGLGLWANVDTTFADIQVRDAKP